MEKVHAVCCACLSFAPILREIHTTTLTFSLFCKIEAKCGDVSHQLSKGKCWVLEGFF